MAADSDLAAMRGIAVFGTAAAFEVSLVPVKRYISPLAAQPPLQVAVTPYERGLAYSTSAVPARAAQASVGRGTYVKIKCKIK